MFFNHSDLQELDPVSADPKQSFQSLIGKLVKALLNFCVFQTSQRRVLELFCKIARTMIH